MTEWPSTLPLPLIDFGGYPAPTTIVSPREESRIARRSRSRSTPVFLSLNWCLTIAQHDAWESFVDATLDNGIALFLIELKYPERSVLTEWTVRFVNGYEASFEDGYWKVSAEVCLLQAPVTEVAPLAGWVPFYVQPASPGDVVPFVDSGDFAYHTKSS